MSNFRPFWGNLEPLVTFSSVRHYDNAEERLFFSHESELWSKSLDLLFWRETGETISKKWSLRTPGFYYFPKFFFFFKRFYFSCSAPANNLSIRDMRSSCAMSLVLFSFSLTTFFQMSGQRDAKYYSVYLKRPKCSIIVIPVFWIPNVPFQLSPTPLPCTHTILSQWTPLKLVAMFAYPFNRF